MLPREMVEMDKIATFNNHLSRCTNRQGMEGYGPHAGKWKEMDND